MALIVDGPDALDPAVPKMARVHWVFYNLPANVAVLPEGWSNCLRPLSGFNDWQDANYVGSCPLVGRHRYCHKLYALDTVQPDLGRPSKMALEA